jgi:hypothetical protein
MAAALHASYAVLQSRCIAINASTAGAADIGINKQYKSSRTAAAL